METPLVHGYDGMKKKNLHFQIQEENETQHENLSDLANKSNYLTSKSAELELDKKKKDEIQNINIKNHSPRSMKRMVLINHK